MQDGAWYLLIPYVHKILADLERLVEYELARRALAIRNQDDPEPSLPQSPKGDAQPPHQSPLVDERSPGRLP